MKKKDMELFCYYIKGRRCPFNMADSINDIKGIGSLECKICEHFKGKKNNNTIYCQKQGELKEKEAK